MIIGCMIIGCMIIGCMIKKYRPYEIRKKGKNELRYSGLDYRKLGAEDGYVFVDITIYAIEKGAW